MTAENLADLTTDIPVEEAEPKAEPVTTVFERIAVVVTEVEEGITRDLGPSVRKL